MAEEPALIDINTVSKTSLNVGTAILASVVATVLLIGSYDFFTERIQNKCEMTWIYDFPIFMKVSLGDEIDEKYPMYGLYMYDEDGQAQHYNGVPVLFIPGNAGSYKQARSLASTALYKSQDDKYPFYFDFFTLDFNEEISGLYGNVLNRQLAYSRIALDKIISMYSDNQKVVVIGHSMGGMIAKTINRNEIRSHLIITLATPHSHPAVIADPSFDLFYYHSQLNLKKMQNTVLNITVVSVSGGENDLIVADKLTLSPTNDFQTSTTSVPMNWLPVDHSCILWCSQFLAVVVRILFDLVGFYGRDDMGFSTDPKLINSILSYHLKKKSTWAKSYYSAHSVEYLSKPSEALWEETQGHTYCKEGTSKKSYVMLTLLNKTETIKGNPKNDGIIVTTNNKVTGNWIFGCINQDFHDNVSYCSKDDNLTPFGEILPNLCKVAHLNYTTIEKYSHIVVKTLPQDTSFCVHMEVSNHAKDYRPLTMKSFNTENKIFFNFSLNSWMRRASAWRVNAELANGSTCEKSSANSVALFRHENFQSHSIIGNIYYGSLIIRFANWSTGNANLILYMDPRCNYKISVEIAFLETAGQIFRTYYNLLPAYFTSVLLLSMFFQRHHEKWERLHLLILKNAFQLTFIPGLLVGGLLTFTPTDYLKIMDKNEVSVYLPLFCYLAAVVCVFLATAGGWYVLVGCGNALHILLTKYLSKKFQNFPDLSFLCKPFQADKKSGSALEFTFTKFPVLVAVLLISLTLVTCGGLGIFIGLCLYFVKLVKMYNDVLTDLMNGKIKSVEEGFPPLYSHQTIACLWLVVTALNFPSLIFWKSNFGFEASPQLDMSLYISLLLTPVFSIICQDFAPKFDAITWTFHRYFSYITGILVVLWGTHRLYIISVFTTLNLLAFAFTQLYYNCCLKSVGVGVVSTAMCSYKDPLKVSSDVPCESCTLKPYCNKGITKHRGSKELSVPSERLSAITETKEESDEE